MKADLVPGDHGWGSELSVVGGPELYLTPTPHPVAELRAHAAQRPLESYTLLIADQCEELFTLCRDRAEREIWLDTVCRLACDGLPIVLGMRADFYGQALTHPQLLAALRVRALPLGPMSIPELRQAITEPAAREGLTLEPGLVEVLLRDLGADPGTRLCPPGALPLLSHALLTTWQHRQDGMLTLSGYERTGGVHGAVTATAERTYGQLDQDEQGVVRAVMLSMIRVGDDGNDTRRPARRDELTEAVPAAHTVLEAFTRARLLTAGAGHVEISHEALLRAWPRLNTWIDEDRAVLRTRQQLTEATRLWHQEARDPHLLYRGPRLAAAQEAAAVYGVGKDEHDFLAASHSQRKADERDRHGRTRRRRTLAAAMTLLCLVALSTIVFAGQQAVFADRQTAQRRAGELAMTAVGARAGRPETADLMAAEAYRLDPSAARSRSALLDAQSDLLAGRLPVRPGRGGGIAQAVSDNKRILATYDNAGRIEIWDLPTRTFRRELATGSGTVYPYAITVSADGSTIVVGKNDETRSWVWVWSHGRARTFPFPFHVDSVALRPDGQALAVSGSSDTVRILDPQTGEMQSALTGSHSSVVQGVAYSRDGRQVAAAGQEGTVTVWRTDDPHTPPAPAPSPGRTSSEWPSHPTAVTCPPSDTTGRPSCGTSLTTASDRSPHRRPPPAPLSSPSPSAPTTACSSSEATTCGPPCGASGTPPCSCLWPGTQAPSAARPSLTGGRTLATTAVDGRTVFWDLGRGLIPAAGEPHESVTFVLGGKAVVTGGGSGTTPRKWNTTTSTYEGTFRGHSGGVYRTATDRKGNILATAGWDGSVRLWDPATRRTNRVLLPEQKAALGICGLAVSSSGRLVVAGDSRGTIHIWTHTDTWEHHSLRLPGSYAAPCALAISHNEHQLAVGNDLNQIHLLDLDRPAMPRLLGSHNDSVRSLAYTRDGTSLASASDDHDVRVWDLRHPGDFRILTGFTSEARAVAYSPDQSLLAASSSDGVIILWNTRTYRIYATITSHESRVESIAFHPYKPLLASAGIDGTIRFWSLDLPRVRKQICLRALPVGKQNWPKYALDVPVPANCG